MHSASGKSSNNPAQAIYLMSEVDKTPTNTYIGISIARGVINYS